MPGSLDADDRIRVISRGPEKVGQGFIRLQKSLAKIAEFIVMDMVILAMFSIKQINTFPVPAKEEFNYPTNVNIVDNTISVMREAFTIRLATHLREKEWKCTNVSLHHSFSAKSKPILADFLSQTTSCLYAMFYREAY